MELFEKHLWFHGIPWNLSNKTSSSMEFHGILSNSKIPWNSMELFHAPGFQGIPWNSMELLMFQRKAPWNSMERFNECVTGAAGISPPHPSMRGLESVYRVQLGCLPLTWVCMISVGKNREILVQLGYLPFTSAAAICQDRLYESIHQSSCHHLIHIYFLCPCWLSIYALGHKGLHP